MQLMCKYEVLLVYAFANLYHTLIILTTIHTKMNFTHFFKVPKYFLRKTTSRKKMFLYILTKL